ncbi:MAG: hypothetical protein MUP74_04065 [Desulfobacterales bacterium]|nr:hypothetical protein [Desulfobacterales bacterium]
MEELKDVLGIIANGLKSLAAGMSAIAEKVGEITTKVAPQTPEAQSPPAQIKSAAPQKRKTSRKPKKTAAQKIGKKTAGKTVKKAQPQKEKTASAIDTVLRAISDTDNGVNVAAIREKTGFDARKISNILYRLKKMGKIKNAKKGAYTKNT